MNCQQPEKTKGKIKMMKFNKYRSKGDGNGAVTDDGDHRGYRTHLIFAGKRDPESASGQLAASPPGSNLFGVRSPTKSVSHSNHPFAQAQYVPETPLESYGNRNGKDTVINLQVRDDAFTNKAPLISNRARAPTAVGGVPGGPLSGDKDKHRGVVAQKGGHHGVGDKPSNKGNASHDPPGMVEVIAGLSTEKDCFIIPLACVDRFLPAGLTLPQLQSRSNSNLNVLEVPDPQEAVVVHLMTPLIPLNQATHTPTNQPERVQRRLAIELSEKAKSEGQASHGLLLASMENSYFPFMALYIIPKVRTDATDFLEKARKNAIQVFDPSVIKHCGDNFFHLCCEVATIARPSMDFDATGKISQTSSTGYIVSIFRVFDGDDREKLERNWLYWTGARTLYRHLPKSVGLRRITLHKSDAVRGDKIYLLLVECCNFLENVGSAAQLLPPLRARLCGYTGFYRIAHVF